MDDLANAIADATGAPQIRSPMVIETSGTSSPQQSNNTQSSAFDKAASAEGVSGPVANIARSIYTQESSGGANTKTSNAGAVGGMQVQPGTFNDVADKGWNINDPVQNARAGIRYVKQMYGQAGGDPALTAAGYYGGPGGLEKARQGIAVSDPRNPNAPNTLQYGQQVAGRLQGSQSGYQAPEAFNADTVISALTGEGAPNTDEAKIAVNGPSQVNQIPGGYGDGNTQTTVSKPETMWDKAKGLGEAALATGTGLVAGAVGPLAGAAYGITHGYGTAEGARAAENVGGDVAEKLTYQPSTQAGQRYAQNVGDAVNDSGVIALAPISDMQMLGHMKKPSAGIPVSDITQEAPARVEPMMKPRIKLSVDGSQTPIDATGAPIQQVPITVKATGPQSVGAAASSYSQQARAAGVTPEVQAAIDATEGTPSFNRTAAERHIEASSLPVPMELSDGQATGNIHQISYEQNNRGKFPEYGNRFNAQNGQLVENINAIRDESSPQIFGANHVENGQSLIDFYNAKDAGLNADISAKYQALKDANGGEFPLKGSDFVNSADKALKADNVTRFLPSEVGGILGDLREGGPMTYSDFENYRTILAQQARKAARSGDGTAEHAISLVRNSLENIPMSDETAAIKPLADAARSAAKSRFDLLRQDPAYNAAVNGSVAPDDFINKFVIKGKTGDLGVMRDNLMDEPMAQQVIAAGTINHLKTRAGITGNEGNFNQAGYNKALEALSPKLNQLVPPEQARNLQSLGNVARYTMEQKRGTYVNNANTLVGALANSAKEVGLGVLNAKTFGTSGYIRGKLAEHAATKSVNESLKPGAGLTRISNFP